MGNVLKMNRKCKIKFFVWDFTFGKNKIFKFYIDILEHNFLCSYLLIAITSSCICNLKIVNLSIIHYSLFIIYF